MAPKFSYTDGLLQSNIHMMIRIIDAVQALPNLPNELSLFLNNLDVKRNYELLQKLINYQLESSDEDWGTEIRLFVELVEAIPFISEQ